MHLKKGVFGLVIGKRIISGGAHIDHLRRDVKYGERVSLLPARVAATPSARSVLRRIARMALALLPSGRMRRFATLLGLEIAMMITTTRTRRA
jgi:hypothetical protein